VGRGEAVLACYVTLCNRYNGSTDGCIGEHAFEMQLCLLVAAVLVMAVLPLPA
jgi:hypothetical protein